MKILIISAKCLGGLADMVRDALRQTLAYNYVIVSQPLTNVDVDRDISEYSVIVCLDVNNGNAALSIIRKAESSAQKAVLAVRLYDDERSLEIGPWFGPQSTACIFCYGNGTVSSPLSRNLSSFKSMASAVFVSLAVQRKLERQLRDDSNSLVLRYDLGLSISKTFLPYHLSGCKVCDPLNREPSVFKFRRLNVPLVFEYGMRASLSEQMPLSSSALDEMLRRDVLKCMPNSPQIQLPKGPPMERPASQYEAFASTFHRRRAITLKDLGTCLRRSAGLTDLDEASTRLERFTASAGNLGSVEIFVVVRNVESMESGLYFYQSRDHSLARFVSRSVGCQATGSLGGDPQIPDDLNPVDAPDVEFVMTAAYGRLKDKYGEFAFRLAQFDSGVAACQLRALAASLGLHTSIAPFWDQQVLNETLNLHPEREFITGIVRLWACSQPRRVQQTCFQTTLIQSGIVDSEQYASAVGGADLEKIVQSGNEERVSAFEAPQCDSRWIAAYTSGEIALLHKAIWSHRTSVRTFRSLELSVKQLLAIANFVTELEDCVWPRTDRLKLYLLNHISSSHYRGMYRVNPLGPVLEFRSDPPKPSMLKKLFTQESFATASASYWVTGDLTSLSTVEYRRLLFLAGLRAQRLWLGSLSQGLQGAITAGISLANAKTAFGFADASSVPLLVFACGKGDKD